jgi:hypothetical protein
MLYVCEVDQCLKCCDELVAIVVDRLVVVYIAFVLYTVSAVEMYSYQKDWLMKNALILKFPPPPPPQDVL